MPEVTSRSNVPTKALAEQIRRAATIRQSQSVALAEAIQRALRTFVQIDQPLVLNELAKSAQWADVSVISRSLQLATTPPVESLTAGLLAISKQLSEPSGLTHLRKLDSDLKQMVLAPDRMFVAYSQSLSSIAESVAASIRTMQAQAENLGRPQIALLERMSKLTSPWVLEDYPAISIAGFARIARLRGVVDQLQPFAPPVNEIYNEELGEPVVFDNESSQEDREKAALDAGLNPELIAFPQSEYPTVLVAAGFKVELEDLDIPTSEAGDQSGQFDARHVQLLNYVERRLREAIKSELERIAGSKWIRQRVPEDLRNRWSERREKDREKRGDAYELIHYADFMDLDSIICRRDNWNKVFSRIFKNMQDFQISMQRLDPIRNAIAHNRPLVRTDQVTLCSEALRLLSAFKSAN